MRTDNAASVSPDAALKNFIFYIFPMYEFSHSQGHSLPTHSVPVPANVRFAPKATELLRRSERCDVPISDIAAAIGKKDEAAN